TPPVSGTPDFPQLVEREINFAIEFSTLLAIRNNEALKTSKFSDDTIKAKILTIMKYITENQLEKEILIKSRHCLAVLEIIYIIVVNYRYINRSLEEDSFYLTLLENWSTPYGSMQSDVLLQIIIGRLMQYFIMSDHRREEQEVFLNSINKWIESKSEISVEYNRYVL
ncbi:MAG: hypothetical protein MHPSP_004291, partial [Paramarteilia canceri]